MTTEIIEPLPGIPFTLPNKLYARIQEAEDRGLEEVPADSDISRRTESLARIQQILDRDYVTEEPTPEPKSPFLDVSICIITRPEDRDYLNECLQTLPKGTEVVIVTTIPVADAEQEGLTITEDAFPESSGIILHHLIRAEWRYQGKFHFARARNHAIDLAHTSQQRRNWIMWLDSDDRFDKYDTRCLEALPSLPPGIAAVNVGCCGYQAPQDKPDGLYYGFPQTRIFRNLPHLRFRGRVHEQILPVIMEAGYGVEECAMLIRHTGYVADKPAMIAKFERNIALLIQHLSETDEDRDYYTNLLTNHLYTLRTMKGG